MKVGWRPSCHCIYTLTASTALSRLPLLLSLRPTFSRPDAAHEPDSFFLNTARRNNTADQNTESQSPKSRPNRKDSPTTIQYFNSWNLPPNHPAPWTHHHLISTDCPPPCSGLPAPLAPPWEGRTIRSRKSKLRKQPCLCLGQIQQNSVFTHRTSVSSQPQPRNPQEINPQA
jgi:hypothetical protein